MLYRKDELLFRDTRFLIAFLMLFAVVLILAVNYQRIL